MDEIDYFVNLKRTPVIMVFFIGFSQFKYVAYYLLQTVAMKLIKYFLKDIQ